MGAYRGLIIGKKLRNVQSECSFLFIAPQFAQMLYSQPESMSSRVFLSIIAADFGFHETFAVKKLVMLASFGLCALSTIAAVQSQPETATPSAAPAAEVVKPAVVAPTATVAAPAPVVAKPKSAPADSPQVQKLVGLYPDLIKRISAYGKVCVQGKTCDVAVPSVAAAPAAGGAPRSGEEVYNAVCTNCHAAGVLGAPVMGDKGAWGPRIAKGKDTLYTHAINGFNAMPARGGGELSDQEVKNGVDYMVSKGS
jgi:cytochrome c5